MWTYLQTDRKLKILKDKTWMDYVPRGKMWIDSQTDKILKMDKTWMNHPRVKMWIDSTNR